MAKLRLEINFGNLSIVIPKITNEDLGNLFNIVMNTSFFTSRDLAIIGEFTTYFSIDQLIEITKRIYITDYLELETRNVNYRSFLIQCQTNITDILIDNEQFIEGEKLLTNLENIAFYFSDFYYMIFAKQLRYRLEIFSEKDLVLKQKKIKELSFFLDTLDEFFPDTDVLNALKKAHQRLIINQGNPPKDNIKIQTFKKIN